MQIRSVGYGLISFAHFCSKYENLKCCCKGTKISLDLNFARNLDSVDWVLISSPLWLITSQRREMPLQLLLPIKTSSQNLRAWEVLFLHLTSKESKNLATKEKYHQNKVCSSYVQSRPSAKTCGSLFLWGCILTSYIVTPKDGKKLLQKGQKNPWIP